MKMSFDKVITVASVCAGVFTAVSAVAQVSKGINNLAEMDRAEEQERLALETNQQQEVIEG